MKRVTVKLEVDEAVNYPTPQTVAKLRPDPVAALTAAGRITRDQERAALGIAGAVRLIVGGLYVKAAGFEVGKGGSMSSASEGAVALEERYNRWATVMRRRRMAVGPVLDFACDGLSLHEMERKWKMRHGTMLRRVVEALDLWWAR